MYQKDFARMKKPSGLFVHRRSEGKSNKAVAVDRTVYIDKEEDEAWDRFRVNR
jgi:hypothetical protein